VPIEDEVLKNKYAWIETLRKGDRNIVQLKINGGIVLGKGGRGFRTGI
jgi:hypothetical protein